MSHDKLYDEMFPEKLFNEDGTPVRNRSVLQCVNLDLKNKKYEELKQNFPERFNFSQLNNVFKSFITIFGPQIPSLTTTNNDMTCSFYHDGLKYRAKYDTGPISKADDNGNVHRCARLTIHLPNNGFLYTKDRDIDEVDDRDGQRYVNHHKSSTYVTLDKPILDKIPDIVQYCDKYLHIKYWTFYYNFQDDRVDFEVEDSNFNCVQINFEPGYPEKDFRREYRRN